MPIEKLHYEMLTRKDNEAVPVNAPLKELANAGGCRRFKARRAQHNSSSSSGVHFLNIANLPVFVYGFI